MLAVLRVEEFQESRIEDEPILGPVLAMPESNGSSVRSRVMSIAVELAASRGASGGFERVAVSRASDRALGRLAMTFS